MKKKLGPYIGICDVVSHEQSSMMLDFFKKYEYHDIKLMIGTMTTYEIVHQLETKWAAIFPKLEMLKDIFSVVRSYGINCIHYADYKDHANLSETLETLVEYCGVDLTAIQLDMNWPDPKQLALFQKSFQMPLILQITKEGMLQCRDNPIDVAYRIADEYGELVTDVLIDCSKGKGIPLDVSFTKGYIEAIKSKCGDIGITIAGGLGPKTVYGAQELIREYRVSTDAQGNLRSSGNIKDPIELVLVEKYVNNAMVCYM